VPKPEPEANVPRVKQGRRTKKMRIERIHRQMVYCFVGHCKDFDIEQNEKPLENL
jgi:hypothetical protein